MSDQNAWYNDLYAQSIAAYKENNANHLKRFLDKSQKSDDEFLECVHQTANILAVDGFIETAKFLLEIAQLSVNKPTVKSMCP